ncbi:MAG: hypothetical protein NCW75_11110 [Phycisphaera sp.]|nr:MAG: hypothetical protein NCW75_11110 [Phycisphaera sp.]
MRWIMIALCTLLPTLAHAQDPDPRYVIHIEVDRPVLEPGESATIELRCGFDSDAFWAINGVYTSLTGFQHAGMVSNLEILQPLRGPGTREGVFDGETVTEIIAGQIQSPTAAILADPADPAPLWRGVFTADETGELQLSTITARYHVFLEMYEYWNEDKIDELIEGSATITIVPCRADFNGDGVADIFDFLAFFNAFDAGDPLADFDFDGELTVFDFLAFQNRFDLGC